MGSVIDGDGILHAAAFAAQKSWYEVIGHQFGGQYGLAEARSFCEEEGIDYKAIETRVEAEPISHAIHSLDSMVRSLHARLVELNCPAERLYIGPQQSGFNFRYEFNPEYKANRPPKPIHFGAVRDRLVKEWGAEYVEPELETDDVVAMDAEMNGWVIVSPDKDFDQVVAPRYNWRKDEFYPVRSPEEHLYDLCIQLLTGDATDNIKTGLYRYGRGVIKEVQKLRNPVEGKKVAYTKLAKSIGCGTTAIKRMENFELWSDALGYGDLGETAAKEILKTAGSPDEYLPVVAAQYEEIFGEDWLKELNQVGQQIFLLRHPNDNFRFLMDKYL